MGFYQRELLPRIVDKTCGIGDITPLRARVCAGLSGAILELGSGSGHNLAHLPAEVEQVLAVEPSPRARALAAPRLRATATSVTYLELDGQNLPLDDESVDGALSTFCLCTIADIHRALSELRRVLRPGGGFHFLEHGLSPEPGVARWQHRLTPWQRRLFGGCHLDRPIADLLQAGGFQVDRLSHQYLPGLKATGYLYEGSATPA